MIDSENLKGVIIGAGEKGELLLDCLRYEKVNLVGFLDDKEDLQGKKVLGLPVLGKTDLLESLAKTHGVRAVFCSIGDNRCRAQFLKLARELGYEIPSFYDEESVLASEGVIIGRGVYILPNAMIGKYAVIGDYSTLGEGAQLGANAWLGKGVSLAAVANVGDNVFAEDFAHVGMDAKVEEGATLGKACIVDRDSLVCEDVPPGIIVGGTPAKPKEMIARREILPSRSFGICVYI